MAFALNSLYYATLRIAGTSTPGEVKSHPVHSQIKIVRDHYVKLDRVANNRREVKQHDKEEEVPVVKRVVERTVKENKRIIDKQDQEALESKRRQFGKSSI